MLVIIIFLLAPVIKYKGNLWCEKIEILVNKREGPKQYREHTKNTLVLLFLLISRTALKTLSLSLLIFILLDRDFLVYFCRK